ncbi:alternate-type signal peptide domain-containing protein [Aeromicrobium sp. Leaf350]|uniref:alternate-type signal peptide domain-containing protein n=1 Tax=Aeromicrobium sp. Leaf350 TaxID=2876565 RepID=UPI001E3BCD91|nr:alternate-type signal peptide domain-containing protein [Aeromicrobium sp. Leaf350]
MKKSSKVTLAAVAGVALLASGAGSLAYWNAEAPVDGVQVHAGELKLVDGTGADACAAQPFTFADGQTYVGTNPGITRVVPGDVLTKTCNFTVKARGENLTAALTTAGPTQSANSGFQLLATGSYTVGGQTTTGITSADHNKVLTATIRIEFPFGTTPNNIPQNTNKFVNGYTVTATQVAP